MDSFPHSQPQSRKRGPKPKGYGNTHVLLPQDLIDWAKSQPEGLSGLVRRLLTAERQRRARRPAAP